MDQDYSNSPITMTEDASDDLYSQQQASPRKKIIMFLLLGLILLTAVFTIVNLSSKKSQPEKTAENTQETQNIDDAVSKTPTQIPQPTISTPQTSLSIQPENISLTVGQESQIKVMLTEVPVTALDIEISYDPQMLEIIELKNGSLFANIIRNQIKDGKIIYSASIDPQMKDNLSEGEVFTLQVKALQSSNAVLEFDSNNTITALAGRNTLGSANGAKLAIDL